MVKPFSDAQVKYEFINRGKHHPQKRFGEILRTAVNEMAKLQLTRQEKEFLKKNCLLS